MLPAANRGPGANICAPDVCKTPPPPVVGHPEPYINRAAHAIAVPFSPTVFICGINALNLSAQVPVTTGDEKGIFGPGPKRLGKFVAGNPIVKVDGLPGINLTCPATGNAANAAGAALVPDQVLVLYTHAGAGEGASPGRALRVEDLAARQASLDAPGALVGAMLEGGIGHVRIAVCTAELSTRVHNEVRKLEAEGMRALILDLRGNPGGEMNAALRLAGDFLPPGAILARSVDADGDETIHRNPRQDPYEMPLVVLVDGATASAAELFAGALQAHGRAVIVGEVTHGKGTAQRLVNAADGVSVLYATVARCLLPGGEAIEGRGVSPDLEVAASSGPDDAPLEAASRALRDLTPGFERRSPEAPAAPPARPGG